MTDCGAELVANDLMTALTADANFTLPVIDLDDPAYDLPTGGAVIGSPEVLNNDALTTAVVGGTGTFDVVMTAIRAHLKKEQEDGRISGAEYVRAYIELTQVALGNAVQFLLSRDTSYYQAVAAQMAAKQAEVALVTARVQLATAKAQLQSITYEAHNNKAAYALTKMKLATEEIGYCSGKYQLENILPKQALLVQEQAETARAQTSNTRLDGISPVLGIAGKQRDLYAQQITSYQRDGEVKAMKMFVDAWITQKTIDEGLLPPDAFTNASLNAMLEDIKTNNGLG